MKVKIIKQIPFQELEELIRGVPLMGRSSDGSEIKVYEKANITLKTIKSDEVNPTTFYLLKENIEFQRGLRNFLIRGYGIDTLHLDCALELLNDKEEVWTLAPPVIEVTPRLVKYQPSADEIDYSTSVKIHIPIINDGAHRVALARELNSDFTCVFISKALEEFPFYSHPNNWDQVRIVDTVPKTKAEKKFYSREDCYALYRNFGILGIGKPRGLGN
jgi:hypothetical protein